MNSVVYFNGRFLDGDAPLISVNDGGWLHGAGFFETIRVQNGRVFRFSDHLRRLRRSLELLLHRSEAPSEKQSQDSFRTGTTQVVTSELPSEEMIVELVRRNELSDARVRLTVSAGSMVAAGNFEPSLTICATAMPLSPYPQIWYEKGTPVIVSRIKRSPSDPLAGHKSICYLPNVLALREAHAAQCVESLIFTTQHTLAEGAITNVFLVRNGVVYTPPKDTPVLPGIARGVVLELAAKERVELAETTLGIDDLLDADEVCLTNSMMMVVPVVRVERKEIGAGRPGPVTLRLLERFRNLISETCKL